MFERRDCPEMDRNLLEAAWRFQLVAPLVKGLMGRRERDDYRKGLLAGTIAHPSRGRVQLSSRTLRRWCKIARESGMGGLVFSARKDRGSMKCLSPAALQRAMELREEDPTRTGRMLMRLLLAENPEWRRAFSYTTLLRHLRAAGCRRGQRADRKGPFVGFEAEAPHDMWQGDILYGPPVLHKGKKVRSMLVCWLDDNSRHVCHLEAYPDQTQAAVEDALRKAIAKHGLPVAVFVDNAMVYSGKAFSLACSDLGITKIHSTPRYPMSRGKQERFFRTLRMQLLDEVANVEPMELSELNRVLVAWLAEYHSTTHSKTKQSPVERLRGAVLRPASPEMLDQAFLQWATRQVNVQGEIRFEGNRYSVGLEHAGQDRAVVRFDPNDLSCLFLWKQGRVVAVARAVDLLHRVSRRKRSSVEKKSDAARNYLRRLEQAHLERLAREVNLTRYRDGEVQS